MIEHYVGATATTIDVHGLLGQLYREIYRSYGLVDPVVPTDYEELISAFSKGLSLAQVERPLVIIIDALECIDARNVVDVLAWLPSVLPAGARLIASTAPGVGQDSIERRLSAECFLRLDPLTPADGDRILDQWMAQAGRTLQAHQRIEVCGAFQETGLPVALRLAWGMASNWQSFADPAETRLGRRMPDLMQDVLSRLSANHGKPLVSHTLALLAASRHGLDEEELLDLLSADQDVMYDFKERARHRPPDRQLPTVVWSRLLLDLAPNLMTKARRRVIATQPQRQPPCSRSGSPPFEGREPPSTR